MPFSKRDIFDSQHSMFVIVHPAFEQKSEGSKYKNSMMLVAIEIERNMWDIIVAGGPDDLDDSSFIRNISFLLETQMMDMSFQLEVQTSIQCVTAKVKIKATLHSLGGKFKAICTK